MRNRSASSVPLICFLDASKAANLRLAEVEEVVSTKSLAALSRSSFRRVKSAGVRICHISIFSMRNEV